MPRRNASSPQGNRRGSSSRSSSAGNSFSGKRKYSEKPGKKRFDDSSDSRGKRGAGKFSRDPGVERPYKKFDSTPKREGDSSEPRRSSFGKREGSSFSSRPKSERPFKKFDTRPAGRKGPGKDDSSESKPDFRNRGGSSFSSERKSERPYKKFDSRSSGKTSSRGNEGRSEDSRGFRKSGGTSFSSDSKGKRPYKSSGFKPNKFSGDRSEEKRSFFNKQRGKSEQERPIRGKSALRTSYEDTPAQTEKIRLNKFIANSGVCSRREADQLITMGLISVNGKTITELGYKVNPGDEVRHENKVLKAEKPVYILLNKPKGFLTTTSDPQERNTVMHLIGNTVKERVYPVGRLDRNTTGLLLLTNDGDLAEKLMHPSYNVKKIYKVELDRPLTKADFDKIREGIKLEEGRAMVDDIAIVSDDKKTVGLEIHIGWNRVVRRIFEALEYQVVKLDRSVYAGLDKKDLGRGHWRFLTNEELVRLKHYK